MTSTTDLLKTAEKRVKNGAEYLDEVRPDWAEEINTSTLDLANIYRCILGQLHLWDFFLEENRGHSREYGFDVCLGENITYDLLQYYWLVEISKRV